VDLVRVLIAGGGTAGHINPGLAIASKIKEKNPGAEIVFAGTKRGMEATLVPREGYRLEFIRVRGFNRKLSLDTLKAARDLVLGMFEARRLIGNIKPDIVVGTGGYVCGPVVLSARIKGIPTLIHEQNAFPGVTNKILSRVSDVTAISFEESVRYLKAAKKTVFTGNPVRSEILNADKKKARKKLGISDREKLVVIFGGSLGARKINDTVSQMFLKYSHDSDIRFIFAAGRSDYERVEKLLNNKVSDKIEILPYIYDAGNVFAASDLIVCRAGAITCSELTVLGIPAIMIPSPNVTANHQEYNARALEKKGAAEVMLENDLNEKALYDRIMALIKDKERLEKMEENSRKAGVADAAEKIYTLMQELIIPRKH
jgi:UDP-N-acetylglucosamine--N-acetylmuramyl-(pentapeptide) pyrophosphoryl-undecaprenol N-acetylglucosamine transferase